MFRRSQRLAGWIVLLQFISFSMFASATAPHSIEFNRDIRPILSDNCFLCHGPDKGTRKAKLRLDDRASAIEKSAIVPGKPEESEMIKRIFTSDADDQMPPPETHKKLKDSEKELLKRWIASGAEYQPHWAYMKVSRPPVPEVKASKWGENSIDAFILQNLIAKNVKPSLAADKATLLRRLSLDLTGLPPTLDELKKFQKDGSSKAYERQVDRLLASPHFGERMAVLWLDAVRFSDTVGYHGDQNQNVFPYRDYVINAFNQNKSFAQFTIEQIAGDLLPQATTEQKTATCFNRLNMMTREGGAQDKEYLAKYQADRVRTVSGAWLGSTMACCECHDHKYDPFSIKDFYAMEAYFADVKQWGVYADYGYTPNPDIKGFGNDHPFPPEIEVTSPYLKKRREKLLVEISALASTTTANLKTNAHQKNAFENWRREAVGFLAKNSSGWLTPPPNVFFKMKETNAVIKEHFTFSPGGAVQFDDKPKESIQLKLPVSGWIAAVRFEVVPKEDAVEKQRKGKRQGTSLALSAVLKSKGKDIAQKFLHAEADHKSERYSMGLPVIGVKDMWLISPDHETQTAIYIFDKPFQAQEGDLLILNLGNAALVSIRASVSPFAGLQPLESGSISSTFAKELSKNRLSENVKLTYLFSTGWDTEAFAKMKQLASEVWQCRDGRAFVQITEARGEPALTRVLPRGNWQDDSGEIVQPATPAFLPSSPNPENRRQTRLDLARWLVSPDNPLTARAFVNRMWKQFFGAGLSGVVEDLGAQGEWPVHPELLDWLAYEFMDSGWDVKHIIKLMVMSSTYRQDSNLRRELRDIDPGNRWLASQSPRRLDAEFVRDNALFISGLLNREIGGPSAHPYQPPGYYVNLQFPDRDYHAEKDERQYRRGVYAHWQRTFLQPMMANFDAPSREECVVNRTLSNTPQQGLTLLNDPSFVEASRVFAANLLKVPKKTDEQRIDLAYQIALARPVRKNEKLSLAEFLAEQRAHYKTHSEEADKLLKVGGAPAPEILDKIELAAWSQVCRVVLNLHETITKY